VCVRCVDGSLTRVRNERVCRASKRRHGEETTGDVDETGGGDGGEVSDESRCGSSGSGRE